MKTVVERNGVKAEFLEAGVLLTFVSGEQKLFDCNGDLIWEQDGEPESFNHFFFMGSAERSSIISWINSISFQQVVDSNKLDFLWKVLHALEEIDYDYSIATLEPYDEYDICYEEGQKISETKFSPYEWRDMAKNFAPELESDLATIDELYLWYAYRIAEGLWSIEEITNPEYFKREENRDVLPFKKEVSGAREYGGFYDGIGNTMKVVRGKNNFLCVGPTYKDNTKIPIVSSCITTAWERVKDATGVVVLRYK